MLACLLLAVVAPMLLTQRSIDEPFAANSVMALPRDVYVVSAPLRLSSAPDLILQRGVLSADGNAALGTPISKFVLEGPVFLLNASGLRATAHDIGLEEGPSDASAVAPLVEQLAAMSFETLNIQRGTLHVTTADGVSVTLSDLQAEITGRRKGAIASRGSFTLHGQRVAFDATLSTLPDKGATSWPMKVSLRTGLLEASFDGQVDPTEDLKLSGTLDASTPSIRRVARWFGLPVLNSAGLNVSSLKGRFTWERRTLAVDDAKVVVDGNEGAGTLSLNVSGDRPLVEGTLAFHALDLSQYVDSARSTALIFDRLTSSWSPFDLSFPIMKYIDADLRISAPSVAVEGKTFGRSAASITVRNGKLLANIAELELANGMASAQITTETNDFVPHYTVRGKIENFEPGPVATAVLGAPVLTGTTLLTVDLASSGRTPAEVLRRLSGKVSLAAPEGGKLGFDLKALRAPGKDSPAPGWGAFGKASTSVDQLEARALIVEGILTMDALRARAGTTALGAKGSIDLAERTMDLRLISKPNVPAIERGKPVPPVDMTGAETVSVRGSWQAPVVRAMPPEAAGAGPGK